MKKIFLFLLVCFTLVGCGQTEQQETPDNPTTGNLETGGNSQTNGGNEETGGNGGTQTEENPYVPTDSIVSFSDKNADKVITEPTFDISKHTNDAGTNIKPYQIFGNGMCLQRDAVNRLWGKASSTKFIAAELNGKVYYGTVKSKEWEIYLPKMNAGGPYKLTLITEAGRYVINDVYIGEVFYLGGQSNMEWQVGHSGEVLKDLYSTPDCVNDQIRMMGVPWNLQEEPTTEIANNFKWTGANQSTVRTFSAVGYLFGKHMQAELGCPVGLVWAAVGGSTIECWLSEENYNKVKEIYTPYHGKADEIYMNACLGYNGMLYPLAGINVRGVVWYQGCSNAFGTQTYYDKALKIFMAQCREMFDNENLSFTVCELARYQGLPYEYSIVNANINKVAKEDPYMVVARNLDLGDWFDIHPVNKREIGRRAAYETLRVFFKYDKPEPVKVVDYSFNFDGSVTIKLSSEAELVNGVNGFEVYVDGAYTYDCVVTINGDELTVRAGGEISKVRYGYTCLMNEQIKNDVSKMVTVYDKNGFPLDLFLIEK